MGRSGRGKRLRPASRCSDGVSQSPGQKRRVACGLRIRDDHPLPTELEVKDRARIRFSQRRRVSAACVQREPGQAFGGEGFIMQRLQGDGWAFVHAGGTLHERTLQPNELIRVDTGCIVAFQPSVNYDIQYVGKIKSAIFGGEGLFFATLRGPGRVWLQSLPLSGRRTRIVAAFQASGTRTPKGKARFWRIGGSWTATTANGTYVKYAH